MPEGQAAIGTKRSLSHEMQRFAKQNLHRIFRATRPLALPPAPVITPAMSNPGETDAETLMAHAGARRILTPKLTLFELPGFLPGALCAELIALIEKDRRPSSLVDFNGDDYFRTSQTCDLAADAPAVRDLEARLHALNGIDPAHGEPVQGQRYAVGQEFKPHTDYFEPGGADFVKHCAVSGQRTWTFMIYLNTVEAGGGTRFKAISKTFRPETGKLLCWDNHRPGGGLNPATLHHGMKVRRGVKYIITKWYRRYPWG